MQNGFFQLPRTGSIKRTFLQKNSSRWPFAAVLLSLAAATNHAQQLPPLPAASAAQTANWATLVKQDANLYRVDDKLYRSEQLTAQDAEAVKALGIKSVINLRYFNRRKNQTALLDKNLILLNRPLLTWDIRPHQIAEILHLIEQQQRLGPVLIHCYHGADRTGLIAGMYRIIFQGWSMEDAKTEMQQGPYGHHKVWKNIERLFNEKTIEQVQAQLNQLRDQSPQKSND